MSLEIIIGPMFSGKSTYALSYIRRRQAIGKQVLVIKPNIDNRYSEDNLLITHDKETTPCILWPVNDCLDLSIKTQNYDYIVLEESQFLKGLAKFAVTMMLTYHKHVLIVGLDGDANQRPFGEILECIPWATSITKLNALCRICKNCTLAPFTRKITPDNTGEQIDVGGSDKYEAVCAKHLPHIQ
jgi:thymidine kinase